MCIEEDERRKRRGLKVGLTVVNNLVEENNCRAAMIGVHIPTRSCQLMHLLFLSNRITRLESSNFRLTGILIHLALRLVPKMLLSSTVQVQRLLGVGHSKEDGGDLARVDRRL
jgi:hypothetical protein